MLKWKIASKLSNNRIHTINLNYKIMGDSNTNKNGKNKPNIITIQGNRSSLKVTYEKTSCYFCSEWLDTQTFKEHIIHCGQVLEKCPQSCEAYIQRKRMRVHLKECPKIMKRDSSTNVSNENLDVSDIPEFINRMSICEQDLHVLRSVLNEEIKQRLHLITDVGSLRKHNQISDEWTQKVGDVLFNMKKCMNEEASLRTNEMNRLNDAIMKLTNENQDLKQYNISVSQRLGKVQNLITDDKSFRHNLLSSTDDRNNAFRNTISLENELKKTENKIVTLSCQIEYNYVQITENISSLENQISHQETTFREKIQSFEEILNELKSNLQNKFIKNYSELNAKQINLDYEVKSMKNIVCETEEKCEKLEKLVYNIEKAIQHTHQSLADLEENLLYQKKMDSIQNTRGHLIWKLKNYSIKLDEARKFDGNIQGPLFTNKPFGYTLRLDVFLNGIGNWRGRNIIACLNVIAGDYDTLLAWPCKLQADIVLKDQNINEEGRQDYIRTTIVKRKNDDFHSHQYIHIPHRTVESRNYIKDDAIIFEIKIQKIK